MSSVPSFFSSLSPLPHAPFLPGILLTGGFGSTCSSKNPSNQKKSSKSSGKSSPQLDSWAKTKESHEELATKGKSSRKFAGTVVKMDNTAWGAEGGSRK